MPRQNKYEEYEILGRGKTPRMADRELKKARRELISKLNGHKTELPVIRRKFTREYFSRRPTRIDGTGNFCISSSQGWVELEKIAKRNIRRADAFNMQYVAIEIVHLTNNQARIAYGRRR
jgi:hypothetical protein